MPIIVALFESIPESMVIAAFGMVLFGLKPNLRQLFLVGLIQGAASYGVWNLSLPLFGLHTIILVGIFIANVHFVTKASWKASSLIILTGAAAFTVLQGIILALLFKVIGISYNQVLDNAWLRILFGAVGWGIFLGVLLLVKRRNFILVDYSGEALNKRDLQERGN